MNVSLLLNEPYTENVDKHSTMHTFNRDKEKQYFASQQLQPLHQLPSASILSENQKISAQPRTGIMSTTSEPFSCVQYAFNSTNQHSNAFQCNTLNKTTQNENSFAPLTDSLNVSVPPGAVIGQHTKVKPVKKLSKPSN